MITYAARFVVFLVIASNVQGMNRVQKTCLEKLDESGTNEKMNIYLELAKQKTNKLGNGAFGEVYKVQVETPVKRLIAMKHQLLTSDNHDESASEIFINKLLAGKQNIGQMLDYYIFLAPKHKEIKNGSSTMYLQMELGDRSLEQELKSPTGLFDSPVKAINIFKNVLIGLKEMHTLGISHNDINPKNVVFFNNVAKIIDFGNSKLSGEGKRKKNNPNTKANFPAEQYDCIKTTSMTEYFDIKDAGKILFEMLFSDLSKFEEESRVYILPTGTDEVVAKILIKCFTDVENERATLDDLISLCDQATSQTQFKKLSKPVKIDGNEPAPVLSSLPFVNAVGFESQAVLKTGFVEVVQQHVNDGPQLTKTDSKKKIRLLVKMEDGKGDSEPSLNSAKVTRPEAVQENKFDSSDAVSEKKSGLWIEILSLFGIVLGSCMITAALLISIWGKKKEEIVAKPETAEPKENSETKPEEA